MYDRIVKINDGRLGDQMEPMIRHEMLSRYSSYGGFYRTEPAEF
jgi:hypothetical protein